MIKKRIILVLTCITLALPITGVAAAANIPVNQEKMVISNNESIKVDISSAEGEILDIIAVNNGIIAKMKNINISIDDKSEIIDEFNGKKLTKEDLKKGVKVRAFYGPAVTLSIPPMSYGRKIMVVSENMDNLEQTVGDIARFNNKKHAYIKSKDEATFTFITEKTEIVNDKGEKSSIEDINVGSKLRLYFSEKDEMINLIGYLPSIYMPEKVVILGKQNESLLATEGNISNLLNNKDRVSILVKGKKVTEQGYSEIRLNLDKNIKIISAKNRKELLCKDLKEGQHILVYYDRKVTRSLPPIGNCREIVVLE